MKNVLIISGHPDLENSTANKTVLEETIKLLPNAQVRRLDTLYPDFKIDVTTEQQALSEADIIIWQFPLHWYTLPALMKKWLDDVFVYGFAHGIENPKLEGKKLIFSFTTGAPAEAYEYGKAMNYRITDFMPQLLQTGKLCKLDVQEPIISFGMQYIPGIYSDEVLKNVQAKAKEHAEKLAQLIENL